jgi:hypothetical protein
MEGLRVSSHRISVGHWIVLPTIEGRRRAPDSAKKSALMSSPLPRAASPTNAIVSLSVASLRSRCASAPRPARR